MIQLFKAGTSHVINGITCEMITVDEFGFEVYLDKGYCFKPSECYREIEPSDDATKEAVIKIWKKEDADLLIDPPFNTPNLNLTYTKENKAKEIKEETLEDVVEDAMKETAEATEALAKVKAKIEEKPKVVKAVKK